MTNGGTKISDATQHGVRNRSGRIGASTGAFAENLRHYETRSVRGLLWTTWGR